MSKRRVKYIVEWKPETIKALREHMDMTQRELAEELGVRQQTISEWEIGMYIPRRATQKYLSMVAEREGFKYKPEKKRETKKKKGK